MCKLWKREAQIRSLYTLFQLLVFVSYAYSVQTFHYKLFHSKLHVPVFMHD